MLFDESKKEGKIRKSIQSSTSSDPGYQWESDNFTNRHHKHVIELLDTGVVLKHMLVPGYTI